MDFRQEDAGDHPYKGAPEDHANEEERLAETVGRLAGELVLAQGRPEQRRLLQPLTAALVASARATGAAGVTSGRWLVDLVTEATPHVPIRTLDTLQQHYGPLRGDALAGQLVRNAGRSSAGIGAAGGALSAFEWAAPPALLGTPVQLAAETVAVVLVEVKLIAELHEAYGLPVAGNVTQRGAAYLTAWARGRGVDLHDPRPGLSGVIGYATRRKLRERVLRKLGRNLSTLGPVFTGAAIGAELNRRATRSLGEAVRRDLIRQLPTPGSGRVP